MEIKKMLYITYIGIAIVYKVKFHTPRVGESFTNLNQE